MQTKLYTLFFAISAVFLGFYLYSMHPWYGYGFFSSLMVGQVVRWRLAAATGNRGPVETEVRAAPLPASQWFPIFLLLLFMFVLSETRFRAVSESLYFTAIGLLMLRMLLMLLSYTKNSKGKPPQWISLMIAAVLVEFFVSVIHVYSTFQAHFLLTGQVPVWVAWISFKISPILFGVAVWLQRKNKILTPSS